MMPTKKKSRKTPAKKASKKKTPAKRPVTKKAAARPAKKVAAKKAAKKPAAKKGSARPTNAKVLARVLLDPMVDSDYYPQHLVKKGQELLLALAVLIEQRKPVGEAVYALTHATTEAFNDLQEEFWDADSEIETVAREAIADDIAFLLTTYGYDLDIEEAIAPRDW